MVISNATSQFFIYLALAIVPSFISLVLYLSPKKESKLRSEQYRTVILENLFYNSLFLTLGGWITFFTQDFLYIVIAFFIGGINFLKDLLNYFFRVKRIIDQNARVEEVIIENYDAIISMFKSSSSYEDFQKRIRANFAFSNEIIFNLYKSFKDFKEESSKSENNDTSRDYLEDSYKQLGLHNGASRDDVRKAFREKARILHPDFTGNNDDSEFKKLNEAYQKIMETLS